MPFVNGENVGAYRIAKQLGQGGMATVFKAYHPALDRYVAIKVMHPAFTGDPNFLARFQREARIVAKLDHPHIIPIYDFAEHRGHPYLVMRFIEGETLKARMERGPLEIHEVLHITQAVGEALTYAHQQGVLHRDIKPSNILLTPDGGVYLTDFGLARMAEAGESTLSRDMMLGTPQYISPEQAKGLTELDARTDIYSLGVVLYEALVGQPPFTADTPYAIIHDHIFTPLPLPRELNADLPESVERVLLKALAKEPEDRFQSVEELVNGIEAALQPFIVPPPSLETSVAPPSTAPPPPETPETIVTPPPITPMPVEAAEVVAETDKDEAPREKRRKRRLWPWAVAAAAVLSVVVILGLGLMANRRRQPGPPSGPGQVEQLMEDAQIALEERDLDRALELYRQAAAADPNLISTYVEASDLLIQAGETDAAIEILLMGLDANPDDPDLHRRLAGIALLTRRLGVAEQEIAWLMQEAPEDAFSHIYAGVLALAEGKPCDEARPELDIALSIAPNLPWAHYGLALCHLQEGDPEAAHAELDLVLSNRNTPPLLRARAEQRLSTLDTEGEKEIVKRDFEELVALAGEIPEEEIRHTLKEMLAQARRAWENGDADLAIEMLKEASTWVQQHRDELGEPRAEDLSVRLDRIISLVTAP